MDYTRTSFVLYSFGFIKEFRPSESFVTNYLIGPWKNFTEQQVNREIYPIATYSNFASLILVFLLTDLLRYKAVIISSGVCAVLTYILLISGKSILSIQIVEIFYGIFISMEVAYYTYIYAKVEKKSYHLVSSYSRVAILFGRFLSSVVAQLLTSYHFLDYHQLNYLTLTAMTMATIVSLFLPSVGKSIYFHRSKPEKNDPPHSDIQKVKKAYRLLWKDFLFAYQNPQVIKWSVWWAAATCGYYQILNHVQLIWEKAPHENGNRYNGAVEAAYTIIGAVAVFSVGKISVNWSFLGESILAIFSIIEGTLLLAMARSYNVISMYILYIVFGVIYHTIITIASGEVAKHISQDSYGLIFGINSFVALFSQSVLTYVVLHPTLALDIRSQFTVYASYHVLLGLLFTIMAIRTIVVKIRTGDPITLRVENEPEQNQDTQF